MRKTAISIDKSSYFNSFFSITNASTSDSIHQFFTCIGILIVEKCQLLPILTYLDIQVHFIHNYWRDT